LHCYGRFLSRGLTTYNIFLKGCSYGKSITEGIQGAIPCNLPPTNLFISLLSAPQLNVKRTIWKGLKV